MAVRTPTADHTTSVDMPDETNSSHTGVSVPTVRMMEAASLWTNLPKAIHSEQVLSMEDVDQNYGYILYRTHLADGGSGELVLDQLHSYAQV